MMRKIWLSACLALPLFAASCSRPQAPAPASRQFHPLSVLAIQYPRSLIPSQGENFIESQLTAILYDNLVQVDFHGNLGPELAEKWEVSADGTEYTFQLRSDVLFHNNQPLTTNDVIFTLEQLIRNPNHHYPELDHIVGAEDFIQAKTASLRGLVRIDDHTFKVTLNDRFKFFLPFLAGKYAAIIPAHYAGLSQEKFNAHPIGTGPFQFVFQGEEVFQQKKFLKILFSRNPHYHAHTGNISELHFYLSNQEIDTKSKLFFDLFFTSKRELKDIANRPDCKIISIPYNAVHFLILNPKENELLRNPKVRQLINHAIDREKLVNELLNRQALPAHLMIPYGLLGNDPYYRIDYRQADRLFAELKTQGRISFTLLTLAANERESVAEFLKRELARYQIDVQVATVADRYEYFNRVIYNTNASLIIGGVPDYPSAYDFLTQLIEPSGSCNPLKLEFPALDKLVNSLPGLDTVEENRSLARINRLIEEDSIYIPLYYNSEFLTSKLKIGNITSKFGQIINFSLMEVSDD